jgi:hypothetical protein
VAPYQQGNTHVSIERALRTVNWVQGFFVHKRIISAPKRFEFVTDRMSYTTLRSVWFHFIVLIVHAPAENMKDSSYEELKYLFH